jgi:hypothetical protein
MEEIRGRRRIEEGPGRRGHRCYRLDLQDPHPAHIPIELPQQLARGGMPELLALAIDL